VLGLALALGLGIASWLPLRGRKLSRVPTATWGMVIAHFGVAVALFGMASEAAFTKERLAALTPGETTEVSDWSVTLESVDPIPGPNWTAIEARLQVQRDGGDAIVMTPQARTFFAPIQATSESALLTRWDGQLYAVIGTSAGENEAGAQRWQIRVWWKPFVTFIWYGGLLISLGGAIAIVGRLRTDLKQRRAARRAAEEREDMQALARAGAA